MYDNPRDSSRRIHIRSTVFADTVIERSLSPLVFGRILPVPCIIAATGTAKVPAVCHRPAGLPDICPTLTGLDVPQAVDGVSSKPIKDNTDLQ